MPFRQPQKSSFQLLVIQHCEERPWLKAWEIEEFLRDLRIDFRKLRADFRDLSFHFRNLRSEFRDLKVNGSYSPPAHDCTGGEDTRPLPAMRQASPYFNCQRTKLRIRLGDAQIS